MLTVQKINGQGRRLAMAYERLLIPLSKKTGLHHTALNIILFVANNPDFATARDICEMRGFKRSLVSANVEALVGEGYLERRRIPGDRRKDGLVCTEKAGPIIEEGRGVQKLFAERIMEGLSEDEKLILERCFEKIGENIDGILKDRC